jgi:hypothetical protein
MAQEQGQQTTTMTAFMQAIVSDISRESQLSDQAEEVLVEEFESSEMAHAITHTLVTSLTFKVQQHDRRCSTTVYVQ